MGKLYYFEDAKLMRENQKTEGNQEVRPPYDYCLDRPPFLASSSDVSKLSTEELSRLVRTDNLAYALMGVEYMLSEGKWTDEELAEYAQEINDSLTSLSDTEQEVVYDRIRVIKEHEAKQL